MKGFIAGAIAATAALVGIKKLSEYADTRSDLKDIKDKLKKTCDDVVSDCKDVAQSVSDAVSGSDTGKGEES